MTNDQSGPLHRTYIPLKVLDSSTSKLPPKLRIKAEKTFGLNEKKLILCSNCGNPITTPGSIITVDGKHIHRFTNPSGLTFEIGCFSSADGCDVYDDSTDAATWFEGFSWSGSICANCFSHLGWFYESEDSAFFGLILDTITESP